MKTNKKTVSIRRALLETNGIGSPIADGRSVISLAPPTRLDTGRFRLRHLLPDRT